MPPQKNYQKLHCRIHRKAELFPVSIARIFSRRLLTWFKHNGRHLPWRNETSPYKILVTEKLLMQTDPGHVVKIYDDFFRRFPTMLELSKSKQSEIARAIRPIGFWRQRARHFKKMALAIEEEHHGVVPRNRKTLRSIFGIGEYTADAFLCFAYGEKRAAIDLNSRRVAQRLLFWPEQVPGDEELAGMMKRLIPPGMAREFNWGVIDFANLVCRRKPRCEVCFATDMCRYYRLEVMG